jgi:hypothetical protein
MKILFNTKERQIHLSKTAWSRHYLFLDEYYNSELEGSIKDLGDNIAK